MNWNVQQFSTKRVGEEIRLKAVADVIIKSDVDIFIIIELQANEGKAVQLCNDILTEIHKGTNRRYGFILTDYNGLEVYPYFYDVSKVDPFVHTRQSLDRETIAEDKIKDLDVVAGNGQSTTILYHQKKPYYSRYFHLIDYPDREGRPPAFGIFQDKGSNEFFCIIAWHNMAQMYGSSGPAKNIYNLSQASYITNNEIAVKLNNNALKIKDIILTGDFNVDFDLKRSIFSNCYRNFIYSKFTIVEKFDKTYLSEYDPDKDIEFDSSKKLRTNLFDNFLMCKNKFQINGLKIIDIPDIIFNNTTYKKKFFIDSGLTDQKYFLDNFITKAENKFKALLKADDLFIQEKHIKKIELLLKSVKIKDYDISNDSYLKISEILENIIGGPELYDAMVEDAENFIKKYGDRARSFKKKGNGEENTKYNDCLLLTRQFYSDHLPVILEIEK